MTPTSIDGALIVGGGYAGVHAARVIRGSGRRATILDPTGRHEFTTRLAAVAGGTAGVDEASAPLSRYADAVITSRMTSIVDGVVELDTGRRLESETVVVTAGSRPVLPPGDGADHVRLLRTADQALALRREIDSTDAVVIVGAGPTGVQLAGAIATTHPSITITLIEADGSLLAGMDDETSRHAERILRERGVVVRTDATVERVTAEGVIVDGDTVEGLAVWSTGFHAHADRFGLPADERNRIVVDEFSRVAGWDRTFAAGDVAAHRDARGEALPMSAQVAVQAGDAAGRNAVRLMGGDALETVALSHRGWVVDLGGGRGLAEFGPIVLGAPVLDLVPPVLHRAIDAKHLIETRGLTALCDLLRP